MYSYRGFMLDSARHYQSLDEIKKLIDAIAVLGFNKFHWHLTDDQGWRFESLKYPQLNTVSAVRAYSDFGKTRIDGAYGRVYTRQEMAEVVAYCAERGIDVIPEFDIPGHTSALLAAFPQLGCDGGEVQVKTHQGIFKDVICPAKPEAFEVVCNILDEFCEVFPYEYIHIGGDETPSKHWEECPDCQALMQELGITDYHEYQNVFMNKVIDYLENKGRHCIVWNDAAKGANLDRRAVIQYWWESNKPSMDFINNGGRAILSPFTYYYLDYNYDITPLNRVYSFSPDLKELTEQGRANIIGLEAPVWTEYISDFEHMQRMLFPRLIAVSAAAKGEPKKPYKAFLKDVRAMREVLCDYSFEEERRWTRSRLSMPKGWLKFVKDYYSIDYIKSSLN